MSPPLLPALMKMVLTLALSLCVLPALAQTFAAIPPLSAHVVDTVGLLDAKQRTALDAVLTEYEQRSGGQVAVLLVGSTAPEAIEQYGIRVADAWKLGRKGIDDGVILIVAKDNPAALRRLRIEAGRGVQGSLTDAQSKRILEDTIAVHFRQGDFYGGLAAGVSAITALLDQEKLPAPQQRTQAPLDDDEPGWLPILFIVLIFVGTVLARRGGGRNRLDSNGWGRAAGVIIGSGIGNALGRGGSGGGFGGAGGGFGGGGGGGFSGGGGGFDGGGASGNW
ncbi:MAG: TPM domain-containing protein [Janthinobacterium lividum]